MKSPAEPTMRRVLLTEGVWNRKESASDIALSIPKTPYSLLIRGGVVQPLFVEASSGRSWKLDGLEVFDEFAKIGKVDEIRPFDYGIELLVTKWSVLFKWKFDFSAADQTLRIEFVDAGGW